MEKIKYPLFILLFPAICFGQNLNWQTVNLPFSAPASSMLFIDSLKGYATQDHKLIKTTDGGNNWSFVDSIPYSSLSQKKSINCISTKNDTLFLMANGYRFEALLIKLKIDSSNLIVDSTSRDGIYLRSSFSLGQTELGIDSNQSFISYTNGIKQTYFQNATAVELFNGRTLVSNYDELYISQDTGASWDTINLPNIFSIYSPNRLTSFSQDTISVRYLGFPREEYITFDGGISWQLHDTLVGIANRRPWEYYLTGKGGEVVSNYGNVLLYSKDYGFNFLYDTAAIDNSYNNSSTCFNQYSSSIHIYGDSGKVYKTSNYDQITRLTKKKKRVPTIGLSPNPTHTSFRISSAVCQSVSEIKVYNQKGQIIRSIKNPCKEIDVSNFKSGIYILSGLYQNRRFSSKIIVQME